MEMQDCRRLGVKRNPTGAGHGERRSTRMRAGRPRLAPIRIGLVTALALVLLSPLAWADVQSRFSQNTLGNWSQNAGAAEGPPDGTCANIGNVGTNQSVRDFNFAIPSGEDIVGIVARIKWGVANDETLDLQLLDDTGSPVGAATNVTAVDTGGGQCGTATSPAFQSYGNSNDSQAFWGTSLTAAQINDPDFGLRLTKTSNGQVKADAICLDVYFTDGSGASSCTATEPTGSITVEKSTTGGIDDTFDVEIDTSSGTMLAMPSVTTTGGSGSTSPIALPPDLYSVTELIPDGWNLDTASCDDGTSSFDGTDTINDINLNPGDEITCTFEDSPEPGDITVIKEVVGTFPGSNWDFTGDLGGFSLPAAGGSTTFSNQIPGSYTITETTKAGYNTEVSCDTGDHGIDSVTFTLEPGTDVTCSFVNVEDDGNLGAILVDKVLVGAAPDNAWSFSGSLGSFFIPAEGGDQLFLDLTPGDYTIEEATKSGYDASVSCGNGESGGSSVTVALAAGKVINCTFTNTARSGSITVVKQLEGDAPETPWQFTGSGQIPGAFELPASGGSRTFTDLPPTDYTIVEVPHEGYDVSVTCTNGASGAHSVSLDLPPAGSITCTFTNTSTVIDDDDGLVGGDPPLWGDYLVFPTPETFYGFDLNGDVDTRDAVLRIKNVRTGRVTNTGIPVSNHHRAVDLYENQAVFVMQESGLSDPTGLFNLWGTTRTDEGPIGVLNVETGEVRLLDVWGTRPTIHEEVVTISGSTLRYYDLSQDRLVDTGLPGTRPAVWGEWIVYERSINDVPTLQLYNLQSHGTQNTGIAGTYPAIHEGRVAFTTEESWVNRDLNGDGDTDDTVVRAYDIADDRVINSGQAGDDPAIYGERIAFSQGRAILYHDLAAGRTYATGQQGAEPDIYQATVTSYVWEGWLGADLSGDHDRYDPIVQTHRISGADRVLPQPQISTAPRAEPLTLTQVVSHRQANSVRIAVQGAGIESVELSVYDLSGQRVFRKQTSGSQLAWRLSTDDGRRVANGVYLYTVTARGAHGQLARSEVRKLVVLR